MYNFYFNNAFFDVLKNHFLKYPTPYNISYFWNFGFISAIFLAIQLVTGIFLSMHYCSDILYAFDSVEHIMRDINYGWLLRYLHSNGASFFFIVVYIHIARGLYYQRYHYSNLKVWFSGLLIFVLMMGAAFMGYVLPWGQMSFWGATVIINLVSAIPLIGSDVVYWLWGGFSVSGPTLSRFFSFHFLLPFVILLLVFIHLLFLHDNGSSNPSFISDRVNKGYLPLYPYFILKDLFGLLIVLSFYFFTVSHFPDYLGHSDNYIEANPMVTPEHIVPEWYFLPFYAILRSIPDKLLGVLAMGFSILIFFLLPFFSYVLDKFGFFFKHSIVFNYLIHPFLIFLFFNVFILLGWIGSQPAEEPFIMIGSFLVKFYFLLIFLFGFLIFFFLKWIGIFTNKN